MLCRLIPLLAITLAASAYAQTQPAAAAPPAEPPNLFSRINGLFNGDLPQLDPPGTFKLILRPHISDVIRRDYMRVDTGLRWALNDNFELSTEADVFFTHGLGGSTADGYGVGRVRFGSKYIIESWPADSYETSFGLNVDLPTGHPPIDMTDGHNHVSPTVVVQHTWARVRRLTTYEGLGLDLIGESTVAGTWGVNEPHDDSVSFTAGAVYDVGQVKWTLSGTYATTAVISNRPENFYYIQPGMLWYVPSKYTFHSKTQWIVGLTARTTIGPDGTDFSLGSRVRAEITFRQVMDKMRGKSK